jgi:NDP-sugar pyrophosphorylase family protein
MSSEWSWALFGVGVDDLPIVDSTVGKRRARIARRAEKRNVSVVIGDAVVVSDLLADDLFRRAADSSSRITASVRVGVAHREFGPNRFGACAIDNVLHYDVQAACGLTSRSESAVLEHISEATASSQPGRMHEPILAPRGDRYIWSIGHWVDLLVANLLALQERIAACPQTSEIDPTATVHRTAVVERSVIGAGTTIGPYAIVRDSEIVSDVTIDEQSSISRSYIGRGAAIQTGSLVHGSVVGALSTISFHTAVRGSVLFGQSTISAPVVARSVIGPGTFLARGASVAASLISDEEVSVRHQGRSVPSGLRLLGSAVGRGARIGNGVHLAAGETVPAGAFLVTKPAPSVSIDAPVATPLMLTGNRFRSFDLSPRTTQSSSSDQNHGDIS